MSEIVIEEWSSSAFSSSRVSVRHMLLGFNETGGDFEPPTRSEILAVRLQTTQ